MSHISRLFSIMINRQTSLKPCVNF